MRYHLDGDYQVLFATNEQWEAIMVAQDSGDGATVIRVDNMEEAVLFINSYRTDLGLE